ncbi:MAG: OmpA family protein [Hydrogenophaga sp.]|nr:OmpA family protein [Hydrogenophaga sp.]
MNAHRTWVAAFLMALTLSPWVAFAQAPLRDASVDTMVEALAPPAPATTVRSLRNLVPQPQPRQLDLVVGFDFDSAQLNADSRELLDKLSQALASERLAAGRFRVEGHTDAKGTAAYNRALSHRRAQAVVAYLADHGVAPARLSAVGMGFDELLLKDQPFAADNRRVRIVAME